MGLEEQFEKETGFEVYDKINVKYNYTYIEWLEDKLTKQPNPIGCPYCNEEVTTHIIKHHECDGGHRFTTPCE